MAKTVEPFKVELPTTQRAYTLRLRGLDKSDTAWRDALWATHEAVNKGAKIFGDWLLTLRGGLDHALATEPPFDAKSEDGKRQIQSVFKEMKKAKAKNDPEPIGSDALRELERRRRNRIRDRRILLALSWLSVESAPEKEDAYRLFVVASGSDVSSVRNEKVVGALREILKKRKVTGPELEEWIGDCEPSLSAAAREDAVWIDRSAMFDAARKRVGSSLTREEIWDMFDPFFVSHAAYLTPLETSDDSDPENTDDDKAKDLVQKAGGWLSSRFGTGKGADFAKMSKVYRAMSEWSGQGQVFSSGAKALQSLAQALIGFKPKSNDAQGILGLISGPGYKSATRNVIGEWGETQDKIAAPELAKLSQVAGEDAQKCSENTGGKGRRPWSDAMLQEVEAVCGFEYLQKEGAARHAEFSVMLDHAARRVSIGHSWIKRAEAERRKFKADAEKIKAVPSATKEWLDRFCIERSGVSGAIESYRIRKRAVEGWREVVARWTMAECKTVEDRIAAARETQSDPDIDKFGDIQLFEALAEESALCVWRVNGAASVQPLIDYAAATDAQAKQIRFKVPAYRHPDPLAHPVFCDFGNSRWEIRFAAHDAVSKLSDAQVALKRKEEDVAKAQARIAKAKTSEKKTEQQEQLGEAEENLDKARKRVEWLSSQLALSMGLWTGSRVGGDIPLFWSSKRLMRDLGLRQSKANDTAASVTRADRLGRAAVDVKASDAVSPLGLFELGDWNGRLQAPRDQLDAIAKQVASKGWDENARKMRDRIRWLVSFSAKLQCAGPWIEYAATFPEDAPAKPFVSGKGEYAVKHQSNEGRKGRAKLTLTRLPGLRLLSIDLGHRYAAACAVWQTLNKKEMSAACKASGHALPTASDLFLHLTTKDADGKNRTTIYRRIAGDTLSDGQPHPTPWARLERQFIIKLQGEERPARAASKDIEMRLVGDFAKRLGLISDDERDKGRAVDELMSRAVRIAALGLKRHARRAKITYAFNPETKSIPGMGGQEVVFEKGDEKHVTFLTNALFDWHALATESKWDDRFAREQWNTHISILKDAWKIPEPKTNAQPEEEKTRPQRRKDDEARREKLKPLAQILALKDNSAMHKAWKKRWEDDSNVAATSSTSRSGWHAELRWLTDWIMGRRLPGATDEGWKRYVGGLSMTRIATMKSLYQLHKAYDMRARPGELPGATKKGESNTGFAQSILDTMERMREQRVKQLASRITEAALGIGRIKIPAKGKDPKRPPERKDPPCHAVVIENLTNYRPDELQTRRENRQLMDWSSSKVKKYLSEACQLHGLHLREVSAGYTSRQDSRTGAPGVRCGDVTVHDFMRSPFWSKQVKQAQKKLAKDRTKREEFLCELYEQWKGKEAQWDDAKPLRIPKKGGDLFVSANGSSPAAKGLQADLNAAANIGLKALLDPDWEGAWWHVLCTDAAPEQDMVKGSVCFKDINVLPVAETASNRPGKSEKKKTYLWHDAGTERLDKKPGQWRSTSDYWKNVEDRVVNVLNQPPTPF